MNAEVETVANEEDAEDSGPWRFICEFIFLVLPPTLVLVILLAVWRVSKPTPTRIVLRSDGLYEVQRQYGSFWTGMGGPYVDLKEAEDKCHWWLTKDAKDADEKKLKRTIVRQCQ